MDRTNTLTLLGNKAGAQPYIELLVGRHKGKQFELARDQVSIGRSDESDILFASDAVSRIHAYLFKDTEGWSIRDNGSKNGIQVNGNKTDNQKLESGDLVQVGDFVFRFVDPTRKKAKARERKVDLSEGPAFRAIRSAPSPVWVFGTLLGVVLYLLVAPALVPKRPSVAVQKENVLSAPAEEVVGAQAPQEPERQVAPQKSLVDVAKAVAAAQAPTAPNPPPKVAVADGSVVRQMTKEDLEIKTRNRAKKVEPGKSLKIYLEEGQHYLAQGDFESASIAFNFAILIDPRNQAAAEGMEAAQKGARETASSDKGLASRQAQSLAPPAPPKETGPTQEQKKQQVRGLMEKANAAFLTKKFQKAIDLAEEIRRIEIKGETAYLNEAKQVIDQAKIKQKEEFEPFLKQANSMISEGAFRTARELCDQMLQRDEAYTPAKDCRDRADKEMAKQAKSGGGQ